MLSELSSILFAPLPPSLSAEELTVWQLIVASHFNVCFSLISLFMFVELIALPIPFPSQGLRNGC
jgi:hypothetical protein